MGSRYAALVAALEATEPHRGDPRGRVIRCPSAAHEDMNPSAHYRLEPDGTILVTCYAGCPTEEMLEGLGGFALADLFRPDHEPSSGNGRRPPKPPRPRAPKRPAPPPPDHWHTVRTWEGRLASRPDVTCAHHVRQEAHGPTCEPLPDPRPERGGKVLKQVPWKPRGTRVDALALYRSWDLDGDGPVVVTEGEKATDALREAGYLAVGTYGTAHRPCEAALAMLAGREVVLWPDADDQGRAHMRALAEALAGTGATVRGVDTRDRPHGWDAADASPDEMRQLMEATMAMHTAQQDPGPAPPPPSPGAVPLSAEEEALFAYGSALWDAPEVVWRVPGLVAGEAITLLGAKPKVGKTQLALGMARAALLEEPFLDRAVDVDVVVYLSEQGAATFRDQSRRAGFTEEMLDGAGDRLRVVRLMRVLERPWPDRVDLVARIIRTRYQGQRVLVVVDTLAKWAGLKPSEENDSGAVSAAMLSLQHLAQEWGAGVLVLMHARKGLGSEAEEHMDPTDALRGSNAVSGDADIILHLSRPPHRQAHGRTVRLLRGEGRPDGVLEDAALEWQEDGTYALLGQEERYEADRVEAAVRAALADGAWWTMADLEAETQATRSSLQRALDSLTSPAGDLSVMREGAGHRGDPYRYRLTLEPEA